MNANDAVVDCYTTMTQRSECWMIKTMWTAGFISYYNCFFLFHRFYIVNGCVCPSKCLKRTLFQRKRRRRSDGSNQRKQLNQRTKQTKIGYNFYQVGFKRRKSMKIEPQTLLFWMNRKKERKRRNEIIHFYDYYYYFEGKINISQSESNLLLNFGTKIGIC